LCYFCRNVAGAMRRNIATFFMKYRGVIFDLDGTLADTLDDIAGSVNRVLEAHGYPVHPVNDYKLLVGRGLDNLMAQALPAEARQEDRIARCLEEMIADYNDHCLVKTHLYRGIRELLNELTHMKTKLGVFSNKAEPLTLKIIHQLAGDIPFTRIVGARPGFPKKPDPAGALEICASMHLIPENIIYVGDSDVDMMMANHAGMMPVGVLWGFRSQEELLAHGAKTLLKRPLDLLGSFGKEFSPIV
jgi:phosphoglycolate phosphatase